MRAGGGRLIRALATALTAALSLAAAAHAADPLVSRNWSGYAVNANPTTAAPAAFTTVSASWVLPKVSCLRAATTYSSFWVGLGGFADDSNTIEQIGANADCIGSLATDYVAWYELAPAPPVKVKLKVFAGNRLAASVAVDGTDVIVRLENLTRHTFFQRTVAADTALDLSSAEWIAEVPTGCRDGACRVLPLAQFGKVSFTRAQTTGDGHTGSISDGAWSATPIWMITDSGFTPTDGTGGVPSPLSPDGSAFAVAWAWNVQPPK